MKNFFSQKAKKSLGQNFLKSEKALREIVEAAEIKEGDYVLEIGPGRGALTKKLLEAGAFVMAIEKDETLVEELKIFFAEFIEAKKLELISADALEFSTANFDANFPYKLVANIPYYITGALIEKYLTEKNPPISATLLVQKEVAERIVTRDGKESILSISVKVFGKPKYISTVPAGAFVPAPKVDSAIIHIAEISNKIFEQNQITEEIFFEVVKNGFAHKRKQLGSNLKDLISKESFETCGINFKSRAEELKVEDWICLAKNR